MKTYEFGWENKEGIKFYVVRLGTGRKNRKLLWPWSMGMANMWGVMPMLPRLLHKRGMRWPALICADMANRAGHAATLQVMKP